MSGVLPGAVWAYIDYVADGGKWAPTKEQLGLIVGYLQYFIQAPCWKDAEGLRAKAVQLRTVEDIEAWLRSAAEIGLDPF